MKKTVLIMAAALIAVACSGKPAAPAAEAVPERQVQLDDKGRIVFGTEEERSARRAEADELFNRVRQQYETMRQERFMVEEEEDLKEAKDVEEPETLSEEEAMKRQRALNRQLKKEAPELAKAELSQEAKDELALEEAERVYSEALKTNDPEQIVDAQRALQTLTKKEAPAKGKRKALPKWEKLTPDEKQVYLDGLSDPYDPINTALTNLIDYRELKSETTEVKSGDWNRQDAIAAYEINRST